MRVAAGVRVRVAYEPSGLDVQLGDEVVVAGALLSTWSPRSEWRFGIGARTGVDRRDEHRVDNIRLRSGASYEPRSVAVEVASNGQQFTSTAVPFTFNVVPTVSSFYPERGPTSGSTEVVISGSNLGLASHYKCRFGALEVAASYDAEGGTIHCASAAQPNGSRPLEVSLNAQQYTTSAVPFTFYAPVHVSLVTPDAGPTAGNTLVRLSGSGFASGADYRCKFGSQVVNSTLAGGDWRGPASTLLCVSPSTETAGSVSLEVAINSQDYTSDAVPFFYYAPPSVTSVSPASGIFYGGTTVTVAGTGLLHAAAPAAEAGGGDYSSSVWAPSWRRDLQCRFGTSSYRAAFDPVVEKWFGVSLAAGTLGDDGSVRCVAPTSEHAGLARSLRFAFADVSVVGSNVTGDGAHALLVGDAMLSEGVVQLTASEIDGVGSLVLTPDDRVRPWGSWHARFSFSASGGVCGGTHQSEHCSSDEGLSFSFGDLPFVAFGEEGAGSGLRVSFLTGGGSPRVLVAWESARSWRTSSWRARVRRASCRSRCGIAARTG